MADSAYDAELDTLWRQRKAFLEHGELAPVADIEARIDDLLDKVNALKVSS